MKRIIGFTLVILIILVMVELGLRILDPWGAFAYYTDMWTLRHAYISVADNRVYLLPPGIIQLRGWSVTTTEQGRLVPDSEPGACTLAFVGDSYTFGHGVSDQDPFANQVARQFPHLTVRNLGVNGYNTAQVLATVQHNQADIFVYLVIGNDIEPVMSEMLHPEPMLLIQGMRVYEYYARQYWRNRHTVQAASELPTIPDWFNQSIAALADRKNILMVVFEHDVIGQYVVEHYPATVIISHVGHPNSKADGHPNAIGHAQIAHDIAVYIPDLMARYCQDES